MTDWVPDLTLDAPDGHTWMKPPAGDCPNCDCCTARLCSESDKRRVHCAMIVERGPGVKDVVDCPCGDRVVDGVREQVRKAGDR